MAYVIITRKQHQKIKAEIEVLYSTLHDIQNQIDTLRLEEKEIPKSLRAKLNRQIAQIHRYFIQLYTKVGIRYKWKIDFLDMLFFLNNTDKIEIRKD